MTEAQKVLESVPGVKSVSWDKNTLIYTVVVSNTVSFTDLKQALQKAGFDARLK